MPKNKKIFLIVAAVFTAAVIFVTIDIFSRTTRPGAKKHLIESIRPDTASQPGKTASDSVSSQ